MAKQQLQRDISPQAIKKTVLSNALQRPLTVYPATIGVLGGVYALLFGAAPIALAAMAAGGGVTLVNWVYEYFIKGDEHANAFVTRFRKELEQRRIDTLRHLECELKGINNNDAVNQVKLFRAKYENFHSILDRKLDTTEITYNRYLSIAEQVFLNGLDNLENVAVTLKSISAIDIDRVRSEINTLEKRNRKEEAQRITELATRLELHKKQRERVNDLLLINEKALTQLDMVSTKIANIDTKKNHAHLDMEDAMEELRHLISRADQYSN